MAPVDTGKRASVSSVRPRAPKSSGVAGPSSVKRKFRERESPTGEDLPILPEQQNEQQTENQITEPNNDTMSNLGAPAQGNAQLPAQGLNINPNLNPGGANPPVPNQPNQAQQQGPTLERKYPNPWDVSRPKFSRVPDVGEIKTFWDHIDGIWATRPAVDDDVKKARTLEFVDAVDLKDQWRAMAEFGPGYTYDQWKATILTCYPEIEELVSGSIFKMQSLCNNAKGLERKDLGPFRRFAVAFNHEALKLLSPPALVTNRDLVQMVLDTLASDFAKEVELTLNQPSSAAVIAQNSELKLAPPSAVVQQAMQAQLHRRGDKFTYIQVLHAIDYLMCNWSGRSAMNSLNIGGGLANGALAGNSLLTGASNPLLPTDGQLVDNQILGRSIKYENDEKFDLFAQEIAGIKDTMHLHEKRAIELGKTVDNSFKVINQSLKALTQREVPRVENREYRGGEGFKKGPCYFCQGPHLASECETKEEFIRIGWIMVKEGKVMMGDGGWVPRYPEEASKAERIERFYNNKGITRDSATQKKSSMMNTYMGQYDENGYDRVDHIYDSREDELMTYRAQQNLLANRGNYQVPIVQQNVGPPVSNMNYSMNYSILQRPVQQQAQQVQQGAESSTVVPGMDISQLIQLIDTVRGSNNANREPAGEQFVQTRTGARSDSNQSTGF